MGRGTSQKEHVQSVPPVSNWRTTDQEEIERRKLRAERESMVFRNITPQFAVFSDFSVISKASGQTYRVELRALVPTVVAACTCTDFQVNGLGTCKHVEGLLRWLRRDLKMMADAETQGSPRIDLVPDIVTGRLFVERNFDCLPATLRPFFDASGIAGAHFSTDEILVAVDKVGRMVRVSQEVAPWLARCVREQERFQLRREYEQHVRAGRYPLQETKLSLLPYQREGMLHLAFTERALLADEIGLGKPAQAIAAAALLARLGKVRHVLVLVPAAHKREWQEQIRLLTDLPCRQIHQEGVSRKQAYAQAGFFSLVTYDQILRDVSVISSILKPECVVLAEAQRVKKWNSQTAQAVKRLQSRYLFVLTSSPLENRIDELYVLMSIIDPQVLGPLFRFNREFYALDDKGRPEGVKNLNQLRRRLSPYLLRRNKWDVEKELPNQTQRTLIVPMDPIQHERYTVLGEQVKKWIAKGKKHALNRVESAQLQQDITQMRMLCDSPFILDEHRQGCPKLDEIQSLLECVLATAPVKVVIFSEWERMLLLVRERCERMDITVAGHLESMSQPERRQAISQFRTDPECRVLLITDIGCDKVFLPQVSVLINCDIPLTQKQLELRVSSVWRKQQVRSLTVVNLVAESSVELRLLDSFMAAPPLTDEVTTSTPTSTASEPAPIPIRKPLLERAEQLAQSDKQIKQVHVAHPSHEALHAVDPELGFAATLVDRMKTRLIACEMWRNPDGKHCFLLAIDGDTRSVVHAVRTLCREWMGDAADQSEIEVVNSTVYQVLRKLLVKGVLLRPSHEVRVLYQQDVGLAKPKLSPDSLMVRIQTLRHQAEVHYRESKRLIDKLYFEASYQPLREAICLLTRAYAVQHHLPEPEHVNAALSEEYSELWGDLLPVLRRELTEAGSPIALFRALMGKFD